jgi:hypothetical protein
MTSRYRLRLGRWERIALLRAAPYIPEAARVAPAGVDRGIYCYADRCGEPATGWPRSRLYWPHQYWTTPRAATESTHAKRQAYRRAVRSLIDKGLIVVYGGCNPREHGMLRTAAGESAAETLREDQRVTRATSEAGAAQVLREPAIGDRATPDAAPDPWRFQDDPFGREATS